MKIYEYLYLSLKNQGVTKIFGVPGSYIKPLWENMKDIEIILCPNEADAAFIACGYARESHKLGVVFTTASPGILNSIPGIASANADSLPLIVISGTCSQNYLGCGVFQEESRSNRHFLSSSLTSIITKASFYPVTPSETIESIDLAISTAINGRAGSVHISIPVDIQNEEIEKEFVISHQPDFECTTNYSDVLRDFFNLQKPLIIAGFGCYLSNTERLLANLAIKIGAPIISTMKGKSCFSFHEDMYLGSLGLGSSRSIIQFLQDYAPQELIVVGSSLGNKDFGTILELIEKCRILIFDEDSYYESRFKNTTMVLGSVKDHLEYYLENVERCADINIILKSIKNYKYDSYSNLQNQIESGDIMSKIMVEVNNHFEKDMVIMPDAGNHYLAALSLIQPIDKGSFHIDAGIASMGNAICSCIGMAYANMRKKYVCLTGDGCMLMHGNSLWVTSKDKLPVIFLVFNNGTLGRVRLGQINPDNYNTTDIEHINFCDYAKSFDIDSINVSSVEDFSYAFSYALSNNGPFLIEILCSKDEIPLCLKNSTIN